MNELETPTAKLTKQLKALKGLTPHALLSGALVLEKFSKQNAPVLTGALRASGHSRETEQGAEVVFDVNYAFYVEMGTEKRPANPFVRSAIDEHQTEIVEAVAKQINDDIKKEIGG